MFRFDTGGVVFFYVPDIGVPLAFHLLFGFVDGPAEAVVYFLMDAVFIFIPDKIGNIIDGSLKIMACLPVIFAHLIVLLPS